MALNMLTEFEAAVLNKLCDGDLTTLMVLRSQVSGATALSREETGVGLYLKLRVPDGAERLHGNPTFTIGDVEAEVNGVLHGVDILLWVRDGVADELELSTYQESWPSEVTEFRLRYRSGQDRDLDALRSSIEGSKD